MLVPGDIIAAKFLRQLTRIPAETLRQVLREADAAEDSSFDSVARLAEQGLLNSRQVRSIRRYVAMFELIRHEAFYLRYLARRQDLPQSRIVELIARIEMDQYRRRLGSVLLDLGVISEAEASQLEDKTRKRLFKEDLKVLRRYRDEDFEGVNKPMFPGKKISAELFRVSELFQPPGTSAEVDREIVKLRLEENLRDVAQTGAFEFAPPDSGRYDSERVSDSSGDTAEREPELPKEAMRKVRQQIATARYRSLSPVDKGEQLRDRRVVGPYHVVECLGEGGMGAVFLAEDANGAMAAVKVMRCEGSGSSDEVARFVREAHIMGCLNHPNLPRILQKGRTEDGLNWMAMSLYAGDSLKSVLAKAGQLDPAEALEIFEELLGALQAVHDAGIVHRDIKPDNVFIQPGPRRKVTLIDFGIARLMDDDKPEAERAFRTKEGIVSGSPAYLAPETISSDPIDGRTDIYSAGILLYEMLTGAFPLRAETPYDYLREHLVGQPLTLRQGRRDKSWLRELEQLMAQMLAKEKEQRPATCRDILVLLRGGLTQAIIAEFENPSPRKEGKDPSSSIFNSFFNLLRG